MPEGLILLLKTSFVKAINPESVALCTRGLKKILLLVRRPTTAENGQKYSYLLTAKLIAD